MKPKKEFIPKGVNFILKEVQKIIPENNQVLLKDGVVLNYDILVVATGTVPVPEETEGLMMQKEMDKLNMPHVTEFLQMIEAGGGEIYACKLAAEMFHLKKGRFIG